MTPGNSKRADTLYKKLRLEVRPPLMIGRDERLRLMACSFEEIIESEEEDIQLPERTSPDGRSPYALSLPSPFAKKHPASPQSPVCSRKKFVPSRLCRDFSNTMTRHRSYPTFLSNSPSPDGPDAEFFTLPPIFEGVTSSS